MDSKWIELRFPARKDMLLIARMTTVGVLARADFTLDDMDDVKMGVEEALNCLLLPGGNAETIVLAFLRKEDALSICARAEGGTSAVPADCSEREVMLCILQSMMDTVDITGDESCLREIRMTKRLPYKGAHP